MNKISRLTYVVLTFLTEGMPQHFVEGDRLYSDSAGDIIGSVLKQNVETAERIWKHPTRVVSGIELPMFAVRVLEII